MVWRNCTVDSPFFSLLGVDLYLPYLPVGVTVLFLWEHAAFRVIAGLVRARGGAIVSFSSLLSLLEWDLCPLTPFPTHAP